MYVSLMYLLFLSHHLHLFLTLMRSWWPVAPLEAIAFMDTLQAKVKLDPAAVIAQRMVIAGLRLTLGDVDVVKVTLGECEGELNALGGVSPVHADYYRIAAQLHKVHRGCYWAWRRLEMGVEGSVGQERYAPRPWQVVELFNTRS